MSMLLMLLSSWPAAADGGAVSFPAAVQFETGDTWTHEGAKFRLFGVQACLRDTRYRLPGGEDGDCGLRSIGALAALFSTNTIACQPVGAAKDGATFVVCAAQVGGAAVDVGTALISSGFAFAAVLPSGAAVLPAYAVAEGVAKEDGTGLWAGQFVHPSALLLRGEQSEVPEVEFEGFEDGGDLHHGQRLPGAAVE
ncbi:thermonuclease family protein [Shinella zoogloeoides]|uniref:thermonuclease family protein n=1 Tax=Shinella zoogloeoides TaxID=352475 RepID=UPI00273FBE8A|nr:thermonuclease family protein [Shinella zoogloeoides]WLR95363.1 thermonuclease family protein [Shinella zoogloeoides]